MDTGTIRPKIEMNKEELTKITREIKETLSFGYAEQSRSFSSVDLWNIQRRKKSVARRRVYA